MTDLQDVCVVTDSTADIPRGLAEELGITVVPLTVTIDGFSFRDGDITMGEFFRRMGEAPELPTTSQPSVGAFVEAFQRSLEHCKDVVCVSISHKLSGTIESAHEAARVVGERVHVLDSLNLSFAEGIQAVFAARVAAAGGSVADVKHAAESARDRVSLLVGLDSLHNLAKGGRIGKVSAMLGGMLNLRVLLTVNPEGAFEPVAKIRGGSAAMQASVDWMASRVDTTKRAAFGILHAESPDKAEWLEERVRERFNVAELHVIETGPVIAAHTGTGWGLMAVPVE
jgi:DegV family protein with EDD domain